MGGSRPACDSFAVFASSAFIFPSLVLVVAFDSFDRTYERFSSDSKVEVGATEGAEVFVHDGRLWGLLDPEILEIPLLVP